MSRTPAFLRTTALAALLATGSLIATAQTPASPAPAASSTTQTIPAERQARHADHHTRMAERHQQRLDQLKTRLQLTPEQEPAWRAYVARTAPPDHRSEGMRGERPDFASLTTPQRIERMKAWQEQRQTAHAQRMDATLAFYQALNPAQQQLFDQATVPGFMRTGMKHRHGHDRHEKAPHKGSRVAPHGGPQS